MTQPQQQLFKKLITNRTKYPKIFDEKKCIFIHIPKTAGLSICHGLLDVNAVGHMPLKYYHNIFGDKKFNQYYKFTFVRNPWDRVFSAFNYLKSGGVSKDDLKWKSVFNKYDDFNIFVKEWLDNDNILLSLHFMPQIYFLKNSYGVIEFDFIGKFETLENDYNYLKLKFNGKELKRINVSNQSITYKNAYNKESIEKVRKLYKQDIELLGYDFE